MRLRFTLAALFLTTFISSYSQTKPESWSSGPVYPTVATLVPVELEQGKVDTVILKPNFQKRDKPETFYKGVQSPDPVWQQFNNMEKAASATVNWNLLGLSTTAVSPPDPSGDVSTQHYIQAINASGGSTYRIINKNTGVDVLASANMSSIGGPTGLGDPIVLYDRAADRWMLSQFSSTQNRLIVYYSQTNNPQGSYYVYTFTCPSFPDYPKYAIWPTQDAIIVSTNEGTNAVYAIRRSPMLTGGATTFLRTTTAKLSGFGFTSITPVNPQGAGIPINQKPMFARHRDTEVHNPIGTPGNDFIDIYEVTVNWVTNAISIAITQNIAVSEFNSSLCGLTSFNCFGQPGTSVTLDPLREPIMFDIPFRVFDTHQSMVMAWVTNVGSNRGGVRWAELRRPLGVSTGGWTLYQEGTFAPNDGLNRWMPTIQIDKHGNILLAYATSGTATGQFPSLRYTGRKPCDPLGVMSMSEQVLFAGTGSRTADTRYGDYFHMSLDPTDEETFFFTGQYIVSGGQWRTRNASLKINRDALDLALKSAARVNNGSLCSATDNFSVTVENKGSTNITNGILRYKVNNGSFVNHPYTQTINSGQTANIIVPVAGLVNGNNTVTFVTQTINGTAPDNAICNDTAAVTVIISVSTPTITPVITTPVSCNNGNNGVITVGTSGTSGTVNYSVNGGSNTTNSVFSNLSPNTYTFTLTDGAGCTATSSPVVLSNPPAISVSGAITTQISCANGNNGVITITASGGTGSLQYSINGTNYQPSNIFSGLSAGNYTVYVRDANLCVKTGNTLNLANPTPVNASATITVPLTCPGTTGTVTLSGAGGTGPYTFSQNGTTFGAGNSFSGLAAGTYTFYVRDSKLCVATTSVTLTVPNAPSISATTTSTACVGGNSGTATVNATGGSGGFTYSINGVNYGASNTFSNLSAGTYTLYVKDVNNCVFTTQATVGQGSPITVTPQITTSVLCNNAATGVITVSVTNTTGTVNYSLNGGTSTTSNVFSGLTSGAYSVSITDGAGCTATSNVVNIANPPAISANGTVLTAVTCHNGNNGAITVNASGGTGTLQYSINGTNYQPSNTFSGLQPGSYTVFVRDANLCVQQGNTLVIANPSPVVVTPVVSTPVFCEGNLAQVTVSAQGGTGSYTYSSNGINFQPGALFTGLTPGNYTFYAMDASGCVGGPTSITVNPAAIPVLSASSTPVLCAGGASGTVILTVNGGSGGFTYSLDGISYGASPSFGGLAPGVYTVYAKDVNGCVFSETATVTELPALTANAVPASEKCFNSGDGSITVFVSGGSFPYQYSLNGANPVSSNTFTGLTPGNYSVTVTDANGCAQVANTVVNSVPQLGGTAVSTPSDGTQNDGTITVNPTGGVSPYEYSLNGGPLQSNSFFSGVGPGSYSVTIQDANGCVFSVNVEVVNIAFIPENSLQNEMQVSVFPNPSNGFINLQVNGIQGNEVEIKLYDMNGKTIMRYGFDVYGGELNESIQLKRVASAMYWLAVYSGNQTPKVIKLIIE
ncbi:MAG: T9SS type A sorting domain-containing protein [Flavobacteriales bacterium]|nr:T9SS type A sorting domain-containing protein [Flavobacteriales bacterium]